MKLVIGSITDLSRMKTVMGEVCQDDEVNLRAINPPDCIGCIHPMTILEKL